MDFAADFSIKPILKGVSSKFSIVYKGVKVGRPTRETISIGTVRRQFFFSNVPTTPLLGNILPTKSRTRLVLRAVIYKLGHLNGYTSISSLFMNVRYVRENLIMRKEENKKQNYK